MGGERGEKVAEEVGEGREVLGVLEEEVAVEDDVVDDLAVLDDEDVREGDAAAVFVEAGGAWGLVAVVYGEVIVEAGEEGLVAVVIFGAVGAGVEIVEGDVFLDGDLEEGGEENSAPRAGGATKE